jgi:RNA polymerase sigma-70 factor (ECF subfamily)
MEPDASQLVRAFRSGDKAAAVQLIELFYGRVYNFLRRLSGNEADAADLTQQTFGRVWQRLASFGERSTVSSWIHGIAYHVYVDWRRANGHTEARPSEWWEAHESTGPGPDEIAAGTDMKAALFKRVEALEPDVRATVHCHYYQDLTLQETADALDVATSTVKYRLRQALDELQKKLGTEKILTADPESIRGR